MTLKDKFYKESIHNNDVYPLDEYEKIADEFAIGFAEWLLNSNHFIQLLDTKELLESYKKEKGL